jgi:predicted transcriptional regulator
MGGAAVLQNLSEEIRERLRHAEECRQRAKTALNSSAIQDYLEMEQRWLSLARSYEFTEQLSRFVEPSRKHTAKGS